MARFCGLKEPSQLLVNAQEFKQKCFINGISLFTDEDIWTLEHCDELIEFFVDNPDAGDGDFFEKLVVQLGEASLKAKLLIAEMLWLMFLCPSNTGASTKRANIERVLSWSGYTVDSSAAKKYLSDQALTGVGSSGTAYNTMRWRELAYLIRLTHALLQLDKTERSALLQNCEEFSQWLEQLPENESRQFRHMLLFLLFPDLNERIFGNTDRQRILVTLTGITKSQYNKMTCRERDAKLLELRKNLEQEYETKELDFYVEPLKSKWKAQDTNPENNTVNEPKENYGMEGKVVIKKSLNQILYGPPGTSKTYNTINKALEIVDPTFFETHQHDRIKLKSRFDELVKSNRIGFVTFHQSFSYEDFVEGLKANTSESGEVVYNIEDGIFKRMCDAAQAQPVGYSDRRTVDISGRKVWKMSLGDTLGDDAYIYEQCIENNCVLLGYGNNFDFASSESRKSVADIYRMNGIDIENESNDYRVTSVHNFRNVMSIGDLIVVSDGNRKFRAIAEVIGNYEYDPSAVEDMSYAQKRNVIWHRIYKPSLPLEELFNKNLSQMTLYRLREPVLDTIKLKHLLTGEEHHSGSIPQVHEGAQIASYRVESITDELITLQKPSGQLLPMPRTIVDELVSLVKNQKLTIEQIRNKEVFKWNEDLKLEKYIVNGYPNILAPLVENVVNYGIHEQSSEHNEKRVLIIDEINRGNISNIFGELITLIEPSKRAGEKEALSVKLPYSKEVFDVPSNLHLIGTMNTADKSLAQVDIALRRRFEFVEMMPQHALLKGIVVDGIDVEQLLFTINQRIELLYDREHTIGHSFFLPLKEEPSLRLLSRIFELEILPLLEEYFFEDWERVGQVLGDHLKVDSDLKFIIEKYDDNVVSQLMGENWRSEGITPYKRNSDALHNVAAYKGIYCAP